MGGLGQQNNPEWKTVGIDELSGEVVVPTGSIGFRWGEAGKWNIDHRNAADGAEIRLRLSNLEHKDAAVAVQFPYFGGHAREYFKSTDHPPILTRNVPVRELELAGERVYVATVFDLMVAHYGIDRGLGGEVASSYDDLMPYTPAWQEAVTGVPRKQAISTARLFAKTAEKTEGRSMVILGAGLNHWYHMDMAYRGIINMLLLCGCIGKPGGGWSHYVGQEKLRPQTGWLPLAFALDWHRPPRHMNSTSYFYAHSSQWKYEKVTLGEILSPLADPAQWSGSLIDCNVRAERMGWLPTSPQLETNPLEVCQAAARAGKEPAAFALEGLKSGALRMACEDPDNPKNFPRNLFVWRSNLLGASGKGHEYFLKYLLGAKNGVLGEDLGALGEVRPEEVTWRESTPDGKLDLMVTIDFRMNTTGLFSDIVLPTATWYEKNDLNTTDMHPFIHPLTAAIDPVWEARSDWNIFRGIAEAFSQAAVGHLGIEKDLVLTPLLHDTPGELAQPQVRDWKRGQCEPLPGQTMPAMTVVERDYPNTYRKFTALGPLLAKLGNGGKGISWNTEAEVEYLRHLNREVTEEGITKGMPQLVTDLHAIETVLTLAPETNGKVAVKAWQALGKNTGREHAHLALHREDEKIRFRDLVAQPRKIISSPTWSGIESEEVTYNAGWTNVHELIPWRTLTGRQQFYQDHPWMLAFGEGFTLYKPPIDTKTIDTIIKDKDNGNPADRAQLHHPASEMGHPQHLHRQSPDAHSVARRPDHLDQRGRRQAGGDRGQRLGRSLQSQRLAGGARRGQPAHPARHDLHVSRPGEDDQRAGQRGHRRTRRHPQLGDPDGAEADAHDRRLRPAQLRLQLLRHGGLEPRRVRHHAQDEGGRLARPAPLGEAKVHGAGGGSRMKIRAQIGKVLNLDKCIGCHTCSVTCKQVWTSREGAEYHWFNNVESKPGIGYPKDWENQDKWKGGWRRKANGRIEPRMGGKWRILANIFANPNMPEIDDYYEPFDFEYSYLHSAPESEAAPTARAISQITGERMQKIEWGPNWEEILGGEFAKRSRDQNFENVEKEIYGQFEQTFMFYLPRLCEHCLNPSCAAVCPSGAIYKREEDGIVLIDQEKCRGWRMCVSGCPYKKIYYNWQSGKSEKCIFCYPRIEAGQPTVCSETCVGRIRYLGVLLYDADRIEAAASVPNEQDLYEAQLGLFLDPNDPEVARQARKDGVADNWIEAAKISPVWKMAMDWKVAFPLHPEYRTLPMVWYVPPLSPIQSAAENGGIDVDDDRMPDVRSLRIPLKYLANLLTAGDEAPVALALERMLAMRAYMRRKHVDGVLDAGIVERVGLSERQVEEMYRYMAIADYEDRFVIPTSHKEIGEQAYDQRGTCGFSFGSGCSEGNSTFSLFGQDTRKTRGERAS